MAKARPAAGGGRWIDVPPERVAQWLDGFSERHGGVTSVQTAPGGSVVTFHGADGARAECHPPFDGIPLNDNGGREDSTTAAAESYTETRDALIAHVCRERRVGVLLARLGGYAAGIFEGERLIVSKVGSRLVQGRTAAGGQSQQRFARRREKQGREALRAAGDVAARVLAERATTLEAVVLGGDRRAIDTLREDPRLEPLFALAVERFLTVPDPKHVVLKESPSQFRTMRIRVCD